MPLNIRRAQQTDVESLARLNQVVQQLHAERSPAHFKPFDAVAVRTWFRSVLQNENARVWIASVDEVDIGYVLALIREQAEHAFAYARRFCEIEQIAVASAYRHGGAGKALLARAIEDARDRDVHDFELSSWSFNAEAHRFFDAAGFNAKYVRFGRVISGSV